MSNKEYLHDPDEDKGVDSCLLDILLYTYTSYRLQYFIIPQHANFINGHNTSPTVASLHSSASLYPTGVSIVCNQTTFL